MTDHRGTTWDVRWDARAVAVYLESFRVKRHPEWLSAVLNNWLQPRGSPPFQDATTVACFPLLCDTGYDGIRLVRDAHWSVLGDERWIRRFCRNGSAMTFG